jgi:PHP family Zn ribbon phosphoesterase
VPVRSIVPLAELIGSVLDVGPSSKKVAREVERLVKDGRTEFGVLLDEPAKVLSQHVSPEIVEAILHMRKGEMDIRPGFDGEYGVIRVAQDTPKQKQQNLL